MRLARDHFGVPHLNCDSVLELAHLQGRVAARDRAWQIEYQRWRAEGRLAERLGAQAVGWDTFARQARVDDTGRQCFEALDEETKTWVSSFVDGVNLELPQAFRATPEGRALAVEAGPWQPWTPLSVFDVQHLLFSSLGDKWWRRRLVEVLGREHVALFRCADDGAEFEQEAGSNAWAMTGSRTASGFPIVAGDSHRTLEVPGCYQQIRLACLEFDVVGFTFPGVPGIQHFGHAGDVAWGITNAAADYQDVFVEELRVDGAEVQAAGPAGWATAYRHVETIRVDGGDDVIVEVVETERGPVVWRDDDVAFSIATPARTLADMGFQTFLPLLRSRSVEDVTEAFREWVQPINSVLTADRAGHVRHLVAGRVPSRDIENLRMAVPGREARHSWTGWAGLVVEDVGDVTSNANDQDSGGGLGWSYAAPHRARRIRALLGERTGLTADDQGEIHRDSYAAPTETMRALLGRADAVGTAEEVRRRLLDWDGRMEAQSAEALLFSRWRSALVDWLLDQPRLRSLAGPTGYPAFLVAATRDRALAAWERLVLRLEPLGIHDAEGIVAALDRVAAEPDGRTWGDVHLFAPLHGLAPYRPSAAPDVPAVPLGGDRDCVWSTYSKTGGSDLVTAGSVTRYAWDLVDRSASRWAVPLGSAGNSEDQHFADQLPLWANCRMSPVVTDWAQLQSEEI